MMPEHSSYVNVVPRALTAQEAEWVREIVLCNPQWADVELADLRVSAECTCGCRSVVIEEPGQPQNSRLIGHQGLVGQMNLRVRLTDHEDVVTVLLHFADGSLSLLEVVWYNFPKPVPRSWTEISRTICGG
jgi:hypothetical protein